MSCQNFVSIRLCPRTSRSQQQRRYLIACGQTLGKMASRIYWRTARTEGGSEKNCERQHRFDRMCCDSEGQSIAVDRNIWLANVLQGSQEIEQPEYPNSSHDLQYFPMSGLNAPHQSKCQMESQYKVSFTDRWVGSFECGCKLSHNSEIVEIVTEMHMIPSSRCHVDFQYPWNPRANNFRIISISKIAVIT
eukprot:SAG31_NODE_1577_length_7836_cov_3.212744_8_plen_191_part_00